MTKAEIILRAVLERDYAKREISEAEWEAMPLKEHFLTAMKEYLEDFRASKEKRELPNAMYVLKKHLDQDKEYREAWKANLAVSFKDSFQLNTTDKELPLENSEIHKIANDAADRFLNILCS